MSFHGWCVGDRLVANIHSALKGNAPLHGVNIGHKLVEDDTGLGAWGFWIRRLWEDNGLHQVMLQNIIEVHSGPSHFAIHTSQQATNCGNRTQPSVLNNFGVSNEDDITLPMAGPSDNIIHSSQFYASTGQFP